MVKDKKIIFQEIEKLLEENKVILFMKGDVMMPKCGFSGQVVQVLKQLNCQFATVDILEDEELRQGIKEYTEWPTIPQLYVNKKFIGGCDIVMELYKQEKLQNILAE